MLWELCAKAHVSNPCTLWCSLGLTLFWSRCFPPAAGATNSRSDRITQALSASADSIGLAVTGNSNVQAAAQKSKAFATLATRESTKASDFGH